MADDNRSHRPRYDARDDDAYDRGRARYDDRYRGGDDRRYDDRAPPSRGRSNPPHRQDAYRPYDDRREYYDRDSRRGYDARDRDERYDDRRSGRDDRGAPPAAHEPRGRFGRASGEPASTSSERRRDDDAPMPPRFGVGATRRRDAKTSDSREVLASKWLEQNAASGAGRRANSEKMRREILVGNLVSGQIGATSMCELFNDVLKKIAPEACHAIGTNVPPVLSIVMDAAQKFAFVELRTAKLANAALGLDQIHVMGRPLKIGRPVGYFEDPDEVREVLDVKYVLPAPEKVESVYEELDARGKAESNAHAEALERAKKISASVGNVADAHADVPSSPLPPSRDDDRAASTAVTEYVCLENMVDAKALLSARERKELRYDVEDECAKFGRSIRVIVPTPSERDIATGVPSKAYVRFDDARGARDAFDLMHGRTFASRTVSARFVRAEEFDAVDHRRQ